MKFKYVTILTLAIRNTKISLKSNTDFFRRYSRYVEIMKEFAKITWSSVQRGGDVYRKLLLAPHKSLVICYIQRGKT